MYQSERTMEFVRASVVVALLTLALGACSEAGIAGDEDGSTLRVADTLPESVRSLATGEAITILQGDDGLFYLSVNESKTSGGIGFWWDFNPGTYTIDATHGITMYGDHDGSRYTWVAASEAGADKLGGTDGAVDVTIASGNVTITQLDESTYRIEWRLLTMAGGAVNGYWSGTLPSGGGLN